MKCIVYEQAPRRRDDALVVVPLPDERDLKPGARYEGHKVVEVPMALINALQKAHADIAVAEHAIKKHLGHG